MTIHFYLYHNTKIKKGIIIGFYFRALRICTPNFLNDEFDYIENSFMQLQYPKSFIQYVKIKVLTIYKHKYSPEVQNNNFSNDNSFYRYNISPNK